ncbi:MAG TPA: hypothetical protein VGZ22_18215 [Isosphaeraceae bacterium]|jgi:hypothetical protein|nr:hypothetical protein [Isosphaeraceae bacterium]
MMRWVGIDEAGYGPNLGPLVMTAVVAEGPDDRAPDLWADLPETVSRVGGPVDGLWVDDSKKIYRAGVGLDRLETACLVTLAATGCAVPCSLVELALALGAGTFEEIELTTWLDPATDPAVPRDDTRPMLERTLERRPLEGAPWRITAVRSVVVGPARFNAEMAATRSKAKAHFWAFSQLLQGLWADAADGVVTRIRADKHGGRNFYLEPLYRALPEAWIDRGAEGREASHYTVREGSRRIEICLQPRADSEDGLVALASMVSKTMRELWMAVFNAHWTTRIPDLRPTAGYPGDSARFRQAIEPACRARGLEPDLWWRAK